MNEPAPSIRVEGIYRVPTMDGELKEQLRRSYFYGNVVRDADHALYTFVENCVPLVLFEITLAGLDEQFAAGDFTQEMPWAPKKRWQCAYDEALLSTDGTQVIARKSTCLRGLHEGRVAFYFHYFDPLKSMRWTYGQFSGREVGLIPKRLWSLMPYYPVD